MARSQWWADSKAAAEADLAANRERLAERQPRRPNPSRFSKRHPVLCWAAHVPVLLVLWAVGFHGIVVAYLVGCGLVLELTRMTYGSWWPRPEAGL